MYQGDLHLEIVLVDDGSTDLSRKIADEYAKKEDRIKVIHQENEGASAARNPGLEIAQGEYIAFLDSEDWISWKDKHGSAGIWSPKRMIWESTTRKRWPSSATTRTQEPSHASCAPASGMKEGRK